MKPLAIWIAVVAVVFGGYALVASLLRETEQVFVVVDTSFFMEANEAQVRRELDRIDDRDQSEFALATVRNRGGSVLVHTWQDDLTLGGFQAFGPCSLDGIDQFTEAIDADERILITTSASASDCDPSTLVDWTIVELDG